MRTGHAGRIVFTLLGLTGAARSQPSEVIKTEARTALVEAVVTGKKGEFVRDLAAKDFRIWQDGKEQTITSFSLEAKSTDPHFLVLFFDDTRLAAQDQSVARQSASRFIDANSAPGRLMAIVSYNGSLRVAQNFTDNPGRLKEALNRVEGSSSVTTSSKLERLPGRAADNFGGRNMLQALGTFTKGLGVLPGRKTVVLLTGGLPSSSDLKSIVTAAIEASSRSGVAIYPVNVRPISVEVNSPSEVQGPRTTSLRPGRSGPQGAEDSAATQDPAAANEQFLFALANGTGGFLIRDSGDLLAGLQQIGEEQNEYYVLSYTPPESKEGSCHTLRVKVDRGGTAVRARSSYCATKPQDLIAGTPAAKDLESRAAGRDAGSLRAAMQLPYFYTSPGVAMVHMAMEIPPDALKFESRKGELHSEINLLGIASTPDGSVGARFSDTLKFDFDSQADIDKLKETPLHYEKQFKIAPGTYSFALAFESDGARFGKIEAPLTVEPWTAGQLTLSSVALSRETHSAADIGLVSSLVGDRTPLIAQGTEFVPSGSNQFARSDEGFFYLEVYDPNPASVKVRVRVLDRKTGEAKWDSGITQLPLSGIAGKSWIPAGASLRLNSLAAGSYQLEITSSDSTGKQVERIDHFEIK